MKGNRSSGLAVEVEGSTILGLSVRASRRGFGVSRLVAVCGDGLAPGFSDVFFELSGDFDSGSLSGGTGTGGNTVGRNVSSFGANLAASSLVGNSIATKNVGTSVRTGQLANIKRACARASEFFLRKLRTDLNSFPGSASFTIGSTISPAPPLLSNVPTFRTSP